MVFLTQVQTCVCAFANLRDFGASLTGWQGLGAIAVVVLMAVERLQAGCGAQALSHVGACWVVGMHVVLSGHVVAGEATVTMGHLFHTRIHQIRQ